MILSKRQMINQRPHATNRIALFSRFSCDVSRRDTKGRLGEATYLNLRVKLKNEVFCVKVLDISATYLNQRVTKSLEPTIYRVVSTGISWL